MAIFTDIAKGNLEEIPTYRQLILDDLFFIVQFVLIVDGSNHPFVVQACKDVERGADTKTLDLWARGHYKSTVITTAEVIQKICKNAEERIAIFSHTRPASKSFLRRIKLTFEGSDLLKACFPDVLYQNPSSESPKWSEDDGIIVRRKGYYNEATLEAWGLIEGMPIGKHFTYRAYDDIETPDMVTTPEVMDKLNAMFDVSHNMSAKDGTYRVVGTPYHHSGLLQYLREEKTLDGKLKYVIRLKPATDNGLPSGKPVYLSEEALEDLKTSAHFNAQQLLNPTPTGTQRLNPEYVRVIDPLFIPKFLYKFMVIDPAGDNKNDTGDSWAIHVVEVEPKTDQIGASNIYITSSIIEPMSESQAVETIVRKYIEGGIILKFGYERIGNSTPGVMVHVINALRVKGRHLSEENGNLVWLKPRGRNKVERISEALTWPLNNGKLHISTQVSTIYKTRLLKEMEKFPYWHDDGLDALSYIYDILSEYRFPQAGIKLPAIIYQEAGIV